MSSDTGGRARSYTTEAPAWSARNVWVVALVILAAELLWVTIRFDTQSLAEGGRSGSHRWRYSITRIVQTPASFELSIRVLRWLLGQPDRLPSGLRMGPAAVVIPPSPPEP